MSNRITGANSGIDVDAVVKASLATEQNKIDKAYQQQKVIEYQQEQLKEIVNQAGDFYDKYLDILSGDSLLKSSAYESVSFTPNTPGDTSVTIQGYAGASVDNYTVQITKLAEKASTTIKGNQLTSLKDSKKAVVEFKMGQATIHSDVKFNSDGTVDMTETAKALNEVMKKNNISATAKYSAFSGGIVIESSSTGADQSFTMNILKDVNTQDIKDGSTAGVKLLPDDITAKGSNASGVIKKGNDIFNIDQKTNELNIDNVRFTFNSVNATKDDLTGTISGGVSYTGKADTSKLKDTIINFVNDYNKLMESINTKLWEKRDKDYMPLTEEQKEAMSDKEIELWEKKATTGLLRNDDDLKRIQSSLKNAMSSMISETGLTLESIGIKPVDNFSTKNGMFKIDEAKLTKALNENAEGVKELFTKPQTKDANGKVIDKGGVLTQLQSILKSEVKSSSSSLAKKIGFEGTATEKNNTYSLKIEKQKKLIAEFKERYNSKESSLYKKYSKLEVMLEKLNAQTNSLYSMLGLM